MHDKQVMERDRARRHDIELSRGMEEELQKKLAEYQRTIKALTKRLDEDSLKISDTSVQDELAAKYESKCAEYDVLRTEFDKVKEDALADKERYGKIWNVLMNHYYDYQKRGVRRPLNKIEIEANPEKFVVELMFGVFEAHPSRFKKAIKKQMGGFAASAQNGNSYFDDAAERGNNHLNEDSQSLLPDDQKWWSTQNNAYLTSPSNPDFEVLNENPSLVSQGYSLPSSRATRGVLSSKTAGGTKRRTRTKGVQTDESSFLNLEEGSAVVLLSDVESIASSNFLIDSYSAPNLKAGGSGVLSSPGSSIFMENFGGASVDRGINGNMLKKNVDHARTFDPSNFVRKKKVAKRIILPRMNHLSNPSTPQTDFAISGHPAIAGNKHPDPS